MDLHQVINQQAQMFANRVKQKDPNAEIRITNTAIQGIQNSFAQPVVDIYVKTGGKEFNYNLILDQMSGKFSTIPFINV